MSLRTSILSPFPAVGRGNLCSQVFIAGNINPIKLSYLFLTQADNVMVLQRRLTIEYDYRRDGRVSPFNVLHLYDLYGLVDDRSSIGMFERIVDKSKLTMIRSLFLFAVYGRLTNTVSLVKVISPPYRSKNKSI